MPGGTSVGSAIMSALSGKYVLVLPYEIIPVVRLLSRAV